jgi:hypothetical protein
MESAALTDLAEVVDHLVDVDPSCVADGESIVALQRQLARLEAVVTTATRAFDASGEWATDGARNATAWLATRCHLPKSAARRRIRLGHHLDDLPVGARAWMNGDITAAHLAALASVHRGVTAEALARDEVMLVDQASTLRYESFVRALAYWEQQADPSGTEDGEEARRARRNVYLESSFQGMWLGQITLDPIGGAIVSDELCRLERQLFESDWAEAHDRLGREPTGAELSRTPSQRRADALVEMATRSRTAPADGQRPRPLFSVLVDFPTLCGRTCELAQGIVVSPGSLVPWLDQALIERAVFEPTGRVEVSATARLFTGATRRALELRDRECTHPYCDRRAADCEADHIMPYRDGGPTTQANGRILCGFHNRLRNQRPPPVAAAAC